MTEVIYQKLNEEYVERAKRLIYEYVKWLNVDLAFQGFEVEMNTFPALYAEPFGCFLIALADDGGDEVVGCVALKPLSGEICEMKRLFVADKFKGKGIGKELISRLIVEARKKGYKKMRLDTAQTLMIKAKSLYDYFGFVEIKAYVYNPYPDIVFMELEL